MKKKHVFRTVALIVVLIIIIFVVAGKIIEKQVNDGKIGAQVIDSKSQTVESVEIEYEKNSSLLLDSDKTGTEIEPEAWKMCYTGMQKNGGCWCMHTTFIGLTVPWPRGAKYCAKWDAGSMF